MKTNKLILLALLPLTACNTWLREDGPMTNRVEDFYTAAQTAVQTVNAAYTPLMWEYQGTYYSEFFFGDILSDDALKGGQNKSDMSDAFDAENFRAIANNGMILQYYRTQYQGIARCNLALEQVAKMSEDILDSDLRKRLLGEAYYLRAFYYFRLVRLFGRVPLVTEPIYSAGNWKQPRVGVDEIYSQILDDLDEAEKALPLKSAYAAEDMGRATKGAAQAMLLKVNLYYGDYCRRESKGDADAAYKAAADWGKKFVEEQDAEYSLCPDYNDNFTLDGENGLESVFEVQYMTEGTSDYGEGNGFSRGTFVTILTRSRSTAFAEKNKAQAGWGFNRPTQNLCDEFEAGDPRFKSTVFTPTDEEITTPADEIYLGNRHLCAKRTLMNEDHTEYIVIANYHPSRSPINRIEIRLADVYLMYAEASLRANDEATAKIYLEKVRSRARGTEAILPEFPNYSVPDYTNAYAMHALTDSAEDLELAIRHERRVELAMESHRWYDLCRWGIAKEVMDAYKLTETAEAQAEMHEFVKGKHELLPIPDEECKLGEIEQNPNY